MGLDAETERKMAEACSGAADPEGAMRGLAELLEAAPGALGFMPRAELAARLFGASRFLRNFCVSSPGELLLALSELKEPVTREHLCGRASEELRLSPGTADAEALSALRRFKRRYLLRITLRDLAAEADFMTTMQELSFLAERVTDEALSYALGVLRKRFGEPPSGGDMALVALGKLGGEELNYSSDLDFLCVYPDRDAGRRTGGVVGPTGVRANRISSEEFYSKAVEALGRLLSSNTPEGIAYRVDLRLRPQGQRGEAALSLSSFSDYYMNWGRTWERMALIRARPAAGDAALGAALVREVEPFVWRKTIDYSEVEEIRALKKKIDSTLLRDDIKRGYGGIREAEFFVQTFQVLYGADHAPLRTYRLFNAIQGLRWLGLVPEEELGLLWENYLFLRRLEHFLQMRDDLQTHTLPGDPEEVSALGRAMGFASGGEFLAGLKARRMKVKNMYNSLLGTTEDIHAEALSLLEGDLGDPALGGYLAQRGFRRPAEGLSSLVRVRELFNGLSQSRERSAIRRVLPLMLEKALGAEGQDRALAGLERLFASFGLREAHLSAFSEQKELMEGVVKIFSLSPYLTGLLLSSPRYLNLLIEEMPIRKTMRRTLAEIEKAGAGPAGLPAGLAFYRGLEEIRLGLYFLSGIMPEAGLSRCLSHVAEAAVGLSARAAGGDGLSVVALGKLGGREMTFGSDLDLIFVSDRPEGIRQAEEVIRALSSYTERGAPYSVDARLRPDGTKGPLVNDVEGYRAYYLEKARPWEVQALLKTRPLSGGAALAGAFMNMAVDAVTQRGRELGRVEAAAMRRRIVGELSREADGMDLKLGPGGIEEIEFYVQRLQLKNARRAPSVLVQNTGAALGRLRRAGALGKRKARALVDALGYYRRLDALLRLNGERALSPDIEAAQAAAAFMGEATAERLIERVAGLRETVLKLTEG